MNWYRVWLHGRGLDKITHDIRALSAREAAEQAHNGPLDAFGPIDSLRATVIETGALTSKSTAFFLPRQKG